MTHKNSYIKTLLLIFLSCFIINCEEVDDALYGDDSETNPSTPVTGTENPFLPSDITGMIMWLDASDTSTLFTDASCTNTANVDSDPIACWQDKSGNGMDATQTIASTEPTLSTNQVNSLNAIQFTDDNNHNLNLPSIAWADASHNFTAFIVYNQDLTDTLGVMLATYPNASNDFMMVSTTYTSNRYRYYDLNNWRSGSSFTAGAWNVDTYHRTNNTISLYMNGGLDATLASLNGMSPGAARLGSYTNSYSNLYEGHIAEIVWFSYSLSTENRQKVEGYLAHKWGQTSSLDPLHPYKTDPPTTFVPNP